jgi:hypothetical protein
MSALQLSPIGGVSAPAAGASPAGEAAATQKSAPSTKSAAAEQPSAAPSPQAAQAHAAQTAAHATAATNANAAQTAAAETARQAERIETPSLNLNVGLIGGTFDVFVDLTDPTTNRVVARLYGPKGGTPQPSRPAPTRVRTEA